MKTLLIALAALALASCATITASADQDIAITTEPASATCLLSTTQQSVIVEKTPGVANVQRMFEPLMVTCNLSGYAPAETIIEAKTRGRAYGNILLLGVPAVVDTSTGKGYEYTPDEVSLTFQSVAPVAQ